MKMKMTEGNGSGTLRRFTLVLLVATLMAATMAASAMPAMAKNSIQQGVDQPPGAPSFSGGPDKNDSSGVAHGSATSQGQGACVTHFGKNFGKNTGGGC